MRSCSSEKCSAIDCKKREKQPVRHGLTGCFVVNKIFSIFLKFMLDFWVYRPYNKYRSEQKAKNKNKTRGCSSSGRAPPCQGGGSEFEPRHPLHSKGHSFECPFFIPRMTRLESPARLGVPSRVKNNPGDCFSGRVVRPTVLGRPGACVRRGSMPRRAPRTAVRQPRRARTANREEKPAFRIAVPHGF